MNVFFALPAFLAEAAFALRRQPLRSFLVILGVSMGVAVLITLQIVGSAATGAVRAALGGMDEHDFSLFPSAGGTPTAPFSERDVERMHALSPHILSVVALRSENVMVRVGKRRARLAVRGEDGAESGGAAPLRYGRALTREDAAANARVCVLSEVAYHKLFPAGGDPIGSTVRMEDRRYVVVGANAAGMSGLTPAQLHGDVLVPYTVFERTHGRDQASQALRFTVDSANAIAPAESAVSAYLAVKKRDAGPYQFFDRAALTHTVDAICLALTLAVSAISCIALLVAGIGIMNVMLVSAAERVREIGMRKAVGAGDGAIFLQFLSEAFLLSLIGCALGCAVGLLAGSAFDRTALVALTGAPVRTEWIQSLLLSCAVQAALAFVFGGYPALSAMRRTPLEALGVR